MSVLQYSLVIKCYQFSFQESGNVEESTEDDDGDDVSSHLAANIPTESTVSVGMWPAHCTIPDNKLHIMMKFGKNIQ